MADHTSQYDDLCALGIIESSSIARGVVAADAAIKQAPSLLIMSRPVSSGKHLLMMRGQVAEVEESMKAARAAADALMLDSLELPYLHEALWSFLQLPVTAHTWGEHRDEAVAIIETTTVCAAVAAADRALKTTPVQVRDMRLALGIGGKAVFTFTGELADVEASVAEAEATAGQRLITAEIIAAPAEELRGRLFF